LKTLARLMGLVLFVPVAMARTPDGQLDLIRTPNNAMPALVVPGGEFRAVLAAEASLRLVGADEAPRELAAAWTAREDGSHAAACTVPAEAPEGLYALEAVSGNRTDRVERAVYVHSAPPDRYLFAHAAALRIGSAGSEKALRDALEAVNTAEAPAALLGDDDPQEQPADATVRPAFVLITGPLTEAGAPEQWLAFFTALDVCRLPTFVCPGSTDENAAAYLGPDTYAFAYGPDGFLVYRADGAATSLGPQPGELQVLRRTLKPVRWCVGVTDRYDPFTGLRQQLVLFVDNPLDRLIAGYDGKPEAAPVLPWGATRLSLTPPLGDGLIRPFVVTGHEVKALPPLKPGDLAALRQTPDPEG
jgi:hypothetical protein